MNRMDVLLLRTLASGSSIRADHRCFVIYVLLQHESKSPSGMIIHERHSLANTRILSSAHAVSSYIP